MQNVVNFIVPFFGNDGKPVANGRVHFCKVDTSATTFNGISSPDYIKIFSKDGAELPNPLHLNDCGRFPNGLQPFVQDNTDFKMIVDEPTGLSPVIEYGEMDDAPCWNTVLVMESRFQKIDIMYSGVSVVDSIADLRETDTGKGCVICIGYNERNDFCPARIFHWERIDDAENYGTRIKSNVDPNGCWVFDPSVFVDVRYFGINPNGSEQQDVSQRITQLLYAETRKIYFPKGDYYFGNNVDVNSLFLDKGVKIHTIGKNVTISANVIEDMGVTLVAGTDTQGRLVMPSIRSKISTDYLGNLKAKSIDLASGPLKAGSISCGSFLYNGHEWLSYSQYFEDPDEVIISDYVRLMSDAAVKGRLTVGESIRAYGDLGLGGHNINSVKDVTATGKVSGDSATFKGLYVSLEKIFELGDLFYFDEDSFINASDYSGQIDLPSIFGRPSSGKLVFILANEGVREVAINSQYIAFTHYGLNVFYGYSESEYSYTFLPCYNAQLKSK